MRVLLVDHDASTRHLYRQILHDKPGIEVVGETASGLEAIHLTRQLQPDVVLIDVGMPNMDGVQAAAMIHILDPTICVIGLADRGVHEQAEVMRDVGAMDYVMKDASAEELLAVMRGGYALLREQQRSDAAA